jgi:two-component system sensor histidine kinase DegS
LQKKSLLERLSNSSRQAVVYRSAVEQAREAERQRIAADLHDGPLQSFTSFSMRLEIVRRMFERNPETGFAELRSLQELCTRQATEMRTFVRSMRPAGSDGSGLAAALRQVVTMFQRDSGIPAEFHSDPEVSHDDLEASPELLQILREALHNVQKHSSASRASVQLRRSGESLELLVRDDGRGFPFEGAFSLDELDMMQMGPVSIKQRVRSLGGDLMVTSVRGDGATLTVRVPL